MLIKRDLGVTHSFNEVCVGLKKKLGRAEDRVPVLHPRPLLLLRQTLS